MPRLRLKSTQNFPHIGAEILAKAKGSIEGGHGPFDTAFEHGQWFVLCQCGASWSVVDAEGPGIDPDFGLDFEQLEDGDEDYHDEEEN